MAADGSRTNFMFFVPPPPFLFPLLNVMYLANNRKGAFSFNEGKNFVDFYCHSEYRIEFFNKISIHDVAFVKLSVQATWREG